MPAGYEVLVGFVLRLQTGVLSPVCLHPVEVIDQFLIQVPHPSWRHVLSLELILPPDDEQRPFDGNQQVVGGVLYVNDPSGPETSEGSEVSVDSDEVEEAGAAGEPFPSIGLTFNSSRATEISLKTLSSRERTSSRLPK